MPRLPKRKDCPAMITNNLIVRLKDRSAGEIEKVKNMLLSMRGKIPVLLNITVKTDIRGPEKALYDFMLMTQFNTLEDFALYLNDPVHLVVAEYIQNAKDSSASLCYQN
jgi:hypothetical protein